MENISKTFIKMIYERSREPIPEYIMDKARICLIDYLSVVIAARNIYLEKNLKYIEETEINGNCHIIGMKEAVDLRTAVMINAFNAHILELDDSHRVAMTHLGAPIFSTLLGVAELKNKTIDEVLRAAVIGYEVSIRIANTIQPSHKKRGFHVSGTCCTIGCAIGCATLLGYSLQEMENTFSAAVTSAAGLLAVISGNSEQKPYNIANAAVSGLDAAFYGSRFYGAVDILGDSRGFFNAVCDEYNTEELFKEGYAIETIYQKLYAACRHCHAPMEAMLMLRKEKDVSIDDVDQIIVETYDLAIKGHDHNIIDGISSAKQSIPFGVASACLYQNCGMSAFTIDKINDSKLLDLTKLVKVLEDVKLSELVPKKRAANVKLLLKNGDLLSKLVEYPKGEPENPITKEEMIDKFFSLTVSSGIQNKISEEILSILFDDGNYPINDLLQLI